MEMDDRLISAVLIKLQVIVNIARSLQILCLDVMMRSWPYEIDACEIKMEWSLYAEHTNIRTKMNKLIST